MIRVKGGVRSTRPVVLWISDSRIASFVASVLRSIGIPYTIPRRLHAKEEPGIVVSCRDSGASMLSGEDILLDCNLYTASPASLALEVVKALGGRTREAVLGIDLGLSRTALALLASGALIYSRLVPDYMQLVREVCIAGERHPELRVGVGASPSLTVEALEFVEKLKGCGCRASLVDEFGSNRFEAYGLKGVDGITSQDVIAAIQIALRVYESMW